MRLSVSLLLPALATVFCAISQVHSSPASDLDSLILRRSVVEALVFVSRDGHSHHNVHTAPLLQLNETENLMPPASYWTIDIDGNDPNGSRHPGLMLTHAFLMSFAFFVALPMGKYEL